VRTPEEGHAPACLAAAMTRSIEQWLRAVTVDCVAAGGDPLTDTTAMHDFRVWAQDNTALLYADIDLRVGGCICPPLFPRSQSLGTATEKGTTDE
jgi:hypothetical protein